MAEKQRPPEIYDTSTKSEGRPGPAKDGNRPKATSKQDRIPITQDAEEEGLEKLEFGDITGFKAGWGFPPAARVSRMLARILARIQ